jgi:hypothetical protein
MLYKICKVGQYAVPTHSDFLSAPHKFKSFDQQETYYAAILVDFWCKVAYIWCSHRDKNGKINVCILKQKDTFIVTTFIALIINRYCNTMLMHTTVEFQNMCLITASLTFWIF